MNQWINDPRRRLRRIIENYENKLASDSPTLKEEIINCHVCKIMLFSGSKKNREYRIRSIQTLALLSSPYALLPGLRELALLIRKRSDREANNWAWLLICDIKEIIEKNYLYFQT